MNIKQKKLKKIFNELILPKLEKHKVLQENLCLECYFKDIEKQEINICGLDTGICDSCGKTNELINEFIYYSVKELRFDIEKDMYLNIPRIFKVENK